MDIIGAFVEKGQQVVLDKRTTKTVTVKRDLQVADIDH